MRTGIIVAAVLAVLGGGVAWRVAATVKKEAAARVALEKKAADENERPALVRVAAVQRRDLVDRAIVTGAIRARNEVEVFAKMPGRLESVHVRLGERVRAGQVLAVVEHREATWQKKQAEAAVALAKANLEMHESNLARTEPLLKSGSATEQQVSQLRSAVAIAKAQVAQAAAAEGLAGTAESNAWVVAPITGVVTRRGCDPGTMAGPAMPLFQVQDVAEMKLDVGVEARVAARIGVGRTVDVAVDAWPGERFRGRVAAIQPSLDPMTRRALVQVSLPNEKRRLLANMFARAEVQLGTLPGVLAVPQAALVEDAGEARLYAVREGRVVVLPARVLAGDGEFVGVEGVGEKDVVAVQGQKNLREGARVDAVAENGP